MLQFKNNWTPINSFKKIEAHCKEKIIKELPLLQKQKILTNSNSLPGNDAKRLGAGIALEQTPQHLIINPRVS